MMPGFYARTGNYSLAIGAFARKARENADAVVRKVVIDVGTRIVERSPVGDGHLWKSLPPKGYVGGRFRANWQLSVNVQLPQMLYEKSPPATNYPGVAAIIGDTTGVIPQRAGGWRYFWQNNLPYAQALEDGWSSQAPAGMVMLTVLEFQELVRDAASEVKK
jgi:hypothetical protein